MFLSKLSVPLCLQCACGLWNPQLRTPHLPPAPAHNCPCRRSVLPPTAVRLASRSREGSQTGLADKAAAAEAAAAAASGGHAGGGAAAHAQQAQQADGSAGAAGTAAAAKEAEQGRGARRDGHKKGSSWWRRLYRKKGLQWSDYRIGAIILYHILFGTTRR